MKSAVVGHASVEALGAALVDVQASGSIITQRFAEFHHTLAELLANVAHMSVSPWNPHSQTELATIGQNLVNVGDVSIDAVRLRLLAVHNWRDAVKRFVGHSRATLDGAIAGVRTVVAAASDPAVTSETERKIVAAAQAIADRQQPSSASAHSPRRSRRTPERARSATWSPHSWNPRSSR
jgi:hypothetical protein